VRPVVKIPQHVLFVSMAALHAGGTADHAADEVAMSQALREPALESSANPYRLTPEPFFDASPACALTRGLPRSQDASSKRRRAKPMSPSK